MSDKLLGEFKTEMLSIIKDPFLKKCVQNIHIHYTSWGGKFYWAASIETKNGNTEGKQSTPEFETFDEIIIHLRQILDSLK